MGSARFETRTRRRVVGACTCPLRRVRAPTQPIRDVNLIDAARQELSVIWSRIIPRREYFREHADQRTGQTSCRPEVVPRGVV